MGTREGKREVDFFVTISMKMISVFVEAKENITNILI